MPNAEQKFKDKIVVVTGASAGIGNAICVAFAQQGAHVAMLSRNEARLMKLKEALQAFGVQVFIAALDVADAQAIEKAASRIEHALGPIDIWVNNAMVSVFSPVREMKAEEYKRVTEVTYLGVVYGTLAALRRMHLRNKGTIIQVGSALAYRGIPLQSAYCAAKHAVQGFHDSLLTELLHDKSQVKVTMVQLSAHNTPQFDWVRSRLSHKAQPVPPIYQPKVAANAVLWAAAHYKREHIVGFPAWKAIHGNYFFPSYADQFLAKSGYKSQQTPELKDPDQKDNLFDSLDKEVGAHGRFDKVAKNRSFFFELSKYKLLFFLIILFLILLFIQLIR